jgi:flavorubredoxin
MGIVDRESGARVEEVAERVYQIHLPVQDGAFSFNQYLVVDDEPLLFHTGPRALHPLVVRSIASVMPIERLRYIAYSHCENDECGSMRELLERAPHAVPVTGAIGAMLNGELFDRPTRAIDDGESLSLGSGSVTWLATPHLPHAWECGYLFETRTKTLLCGDLFTQPGANGPALTSSDVLEPSERVRTGNEYFALTSNAEDLLEQLAATNPAVLACMHGSAYRGDGAALLCALGERIARSANAMERAPRRRVP